MRVDQAHIKLLWDIGKHARDVLGNLTSVCQSRQLIIHIVNELLPVDFKARIDPWWPEPPAPDPFPSFGLEPVLDAALGGAIVALRDELLGLETDRRQETEDPFDEVARTGVEVGLQRTFENEAEGARQFAELITRSQRGQVRYRADNHSQ